MKYFLYQVAMYALEFGLKMYGWFDPKISKWNNDRNHQFQVLEKWKNESSKQVVWMHCASLGEYEQGKPVIKYLKEKYQDQYIYFLSFFSPSGYEQLKNSRDFDKIFYLPIDTKSHASSICKSIQPTLFIAVKYEFWWNLLRELQQIHCKVFYVSVIFKKEPYFLNWSFAIETLKSIDKIFTQDNETRDLLSNHHIKAKLGGDSRLLSVIQRKKADSKIASPNIFEQIQKPIFIYGSVYEHDMKIIASNLEDDAYIHLLVPHQVDKNSISTITSYLKSPYKLYSQTATYGGEKIIVIDRIGLLFDLYRYSEIAYVGGGFSKSVHNTLEPTVFGLPILFGPKNEGFIEIKDFISIKVGFEIKNKDEFSKALQLLKGINKREIRKKLDDYFSQKSLIVEEMLNQL